MSVRPPLILPSSRPDISQPGDTPRLDYLELAAALGDAPLLYPPAHAHAPIDTLERRTASDIRQALLAFRQRRIVGAYVSLSEKIGLPLALLLGRRSTVPHVLVAHHLTSDRKRALQARTGWLHRFTKIVVLCREQERYLIEEAGLEAARVRFVWDGVDVGFWRDLISGQGRVPTKWVVGERSLLAVGNERRDYATLIAAARLLPDCRFTIVTGSPWSQQNKQNISSDLPPNIRLTSGLSWPDLRALYAEASAVVVPLEAGTRYAAGVNTVLEAMAMACPLVVTGTPGMAEYVEEGVSARLVPPSDPAALAGALRELLDDTVGAARLGANARRVVEGGRNLEGYVATLAGIVREAMGDTAA